MAYREVGPDDVPNGGKFLKYRDLFSGVGDSFVGRYLSDAAGQYGQDFCFKLRDGSEGIFTVKGPLKAQLLKCKLQPGELVLITAVAEHEGYLRFKVVVDPKTLPAAKPAPKPVADADIPF